MRSSLPKAAPGQGRVWGVYFRRDPREQEGPGRTAREGACRGTTWGLLAAGHCCAHFWVDPPGAELWEDGQRDMHAAGTPRRPDAASLACLRTEGTEHSTRTPAGTVSWHSPSQPLRVASPACLWPHTRPSLPLPHAAGCAPWGWAPMAGTRAAVSCVFNPMKRAFCPVPAWDKRPPH